MAQDFRNALQAMSNTAADTVSAPVDGIAWLLRKAGVPIPGNALMGSDWMRQQGFTAPVEPGAGQIAGETLGLLAPMVAAAKAPQIARGLLSLDDKAMDMARVGVENHLSRMGAKPNMILYHGTDSKDKLKAIEDGGGMFGGLFSGGPDVAGSHGQFVYRMTVPDEKILRHGDDIGDAAYSVVKQRLGRYLSEDDLQTVARLVDSDKSSMDDIPAHLENALATVLPNNTGNGLADASWSLQRLRGEAAKKAGFDAAAMYDEHGTSYLVNKGTARPYNQSARNLARGTWEAPIMPVYVAPKAPAIDPNRISMNQWRALPESEKAANIAKVTEGDRRTLRELSEFRSRLGM